MSDRSRPEKAGLGPLIPTMVGGLPGWLFVPGGNEYFYETAPGEGFECTTTRDHLSFIKKVPDDASLLIAEAGFRATVWHEGTGADVLRVSVRNRRYDHRTGLLGDRDPSIYPSRLIAAAIAYLDYYGDHPITHWRACWYPGGPGVSDDYVAYKSLLAQFGEPPYTPEQQARAAFGTWSGQAALRHGFSYLPARGVDEYNGDVTPLFSRAPQVDSLAGDSWY